MCEFVKRITLSFGILLFLTNICLAYPRVVLLENWTSLG